MDRKIPKTVEKILLVAALLLAAGLLVLLTYKGNDSAGAEFVYTVKEDGYASIDGYSGDKSTIEIPEKIGENNEYTVKYVSTDAFTNDTALKKVVIPHTVEVIGKYAFSGCENLKTVELSEGLSEIGFGAFFKCSSLKNIEFPNSLEIIGASAFEDCKRIKKLKIPENCSEIGADAFLGCENLIMGCDENEIAREVAKSYNIPTSFSESSDSTMLKAGILVVLAIVCIFVLPRVVRKIVEKNKSKKKERQ